MSDDGGYGEDDVDVMDEPADGADSDAEDDLVDMPSVAVDAMEEAPEIRDITEEVAARSRNKPAPEGIARGRRGQARPTYADEKLQRTATAILDKFLKSVLGDVGRATGMLQTWINLAPPCQTLFEMIDKVLVSIMTDPLDIRIVDGCLVLTTNEWMRIYHGQMGGPERALLQYIMDNWKLFFNETEYYKNSGQMQSFYGCFYNEELAAKVPRAALAARFVGLVLRGEVAGGAPGCVGAHFSAAWTACYASVRRITRFARHMTREDAATLLDSVHVPPASLAEQWDPDKQMHPGHLAAPARAKDD